MISAHWQQQEKTGIRFSPDTRYFIKARPDVLPRYFFIELVCDLGQEGDHEP